MPKIYFERRSICGFALIHSLNDYGYLCLCSVPLPSILGKRRVWATSVKLSKATKITWHRIVVPRKKQALFASHGLIGKIHLESDWSEEVFAEVRSVFHDAVGGI